LNRIRQAVYANAVRNRGRTSPAKHVRANRQMQLVHRPGTKQRGIQFAATFAKKARYIPTFAEPPKRRRPIDAVRSANHDLVCCCGKTRQCASAGTRGRDNNDWRIPFVEN